ncbi:TPA: hypothetical protein QEL15_003328 [Stenotrophomonas maltophilia]|nr:hypothetical protein [Stenotrophomonas maltophilia]
MNSYFEYPSVRSILRYTDKGSAEGPQWIENPPVDVVEDAVRRVFNNGKILDVTIPEGHGLLLRRLTMVSKSGECRFTADLYHEDHRQAFLEWWESKGAPFRGGSRYGDDYFDDRTVCRDVAVAVALFREVIDVNGLSEMSFSQFLSEWDPISMEGRRLVAESISSRR